MDSKILIEKAQLRVANLVAKFGATWLRKERIDDINAAFERGEKKFEGFYIDEVEQIIEAFCRVFPHREVDWHTDLEAPLYGMTKYIHKQIQQEAKCEVSQGVKYARVLVEWVGLKLEVTFSPSNEQNKYVIMSLGRFKNPREEIQF